MPYTYNSAENLKNEGIKAENITVIGNPISEVLRHYGGQIESSLILDEMSLTRDKYVLVTVHLHSEGPSSHPEAI
jgi:UDP-N-acetylglucosamine 2-epimerase (non-hydrolysing)